VLRRKASVGPRSRLDLCLSYTDASTVTVHVRRLRAKVKLDPWNPGWLQTVRCSLPLCPVRTVEPLRLWADRSGALSRA
jgi:hypothetical protein